jgi:hypothetical protein
MEKYDALRVKPSFVGAGVVSDGRHTTDWRVVAVYHGEAACGGLDRDRQGRARFNDEGHLVTAVVAVTLRVVIGQALAARHDQGPAARSPGCGLWGTGVGAQASAAHPRANGLLAVPKAGRPAAPAVALIDR